MKTFVVSSLLIVLLPSLLFSDALRDNVMHELLNDSVKTQAQLKNLQLQLYNSNSRANELENRLKKLEDSVYFVDINKIHKPQEIKGETVLQVKTQELKTFKAIVVAWNLNVRSQPNKESRIVGRTVMGDILNIKECYGDWCALNNGFVKKDYVSSISGVKGTPMFVHKKLVNVRSAPSMGKKILNQLKKNSTIEVLSKMFNEDWYKIKGKNAYVYKNSVKALK